MKKALVMYSGGLDSRVVLKIMQSLGFDVTAVHFKLPFGCGCSVDENKKFVQSQGAKFVLFDIQKEPLLSSYLESLKNAKFGYGAGYNPCADCKVWMFKEAKKFFDKGKFDVFATGEVLGQRPMSQTAGKQKKINSEVGFDILRPLSAKLLPTTIYEKKGLVDRGKLFDVQGRRREVQMKLAEKFKIEFPTPSGGCLMCEKACKNRFKTLIEEKIIDEKHLSLASIGRHFFIDGVWFVVARNEDEGEVIDRYVDENIIGEGGFPSIYFSDKRGLGNAKKLQEAFRTGATTGEREKFDEWKL